MATKQSLSKINPLKERWDGLAPKRKKQVMLGIAGSAVLLVALAVISGSDDSKSGGPRTAQGKIQNALMPDEGGRDLGVSAVGRDMRDVQSRTRQVENEVSRLKSQIDRSQSESGAGGNDERVVDEIGRLRREIDDMRKKQEQDQVDRARTLPANATGQPVRLGPNGQPIDQPEAMAPAPPSYGRIRTLEDGAKAQDGAADAANRGASNANAVAPSSATPPTGGDTSGKASAGSESSRITVADRDRMYLPAGSILQGVLLSGVDAPSGKAAMKDPIPVLARIKHDAILPNRFRADIKECFTLLETVGDLASERAMMRAITLACTRKDRSIIEVPLAGYAVGEDGRAGLRGEVVTKQGAVLGRATIAGFADGLSRAFGGGNNFSFGGSGSGVSSQSLESGALNGTSSALDRISQWYLERADELHPTINIDSGRKVTIVLTRGRELATLRSSGTAAKAE